MKEKSLKLKHENVQKLHVQLQLHYSVLLSLYLIHFVPFGVQILFDGLAFEIPVADSECRVWVWFAFHQTQHVRVLSHQVSGLQQVDPHHALSSRQGKQDSN